MDTIPSPDDHTLFDGHPIVDDAEKALRVFEGEPLDRTTAEMLLSMWVRSNELTDRERAAVLARFPEPAPERTLAEEVQDAIDEVYERGVNDGQAKALDHLAESFRVGMAVGARKSAAEHGWGVVGDYEREVFVWTCNCGEQAEQPFDEQAPAKLLFGHMEAHRS